MNLKQYRKAQGLTQQQAGDLMGLSKQRYGQIEKKWPQLNVDTLLTLVEKLGARIVIDMKDGARFMTQEEIEHMDREVSQDEIIEGLSYLPDANPD